MLYWWKKKVRLKTDGYNEVEMIFMGNTGVKAAVAGLGTCTEEFY